MVLSVVHISLLEDLISSNSYPPFDFIPWESILMSSKFPTCKSRDDYKTLFEELDPFATRLAESTIETKNFNTLLLYLISGLHNLNSNYEEPISLSLYNSLLLVMYFSKKFVEKLEGKQLTKIFDERHNQMNKVNEKMQRANSVISFQEALFKSDDSDSTLLITEIFQCLSFMPINDYDQYTFYTQLLQFVIILWSTQLIHTGPVDIEKDRFLYQAMTRSQQLTTERLIRRLIYNYITDPQDQAPASGVLYSTYSYLFSKSSKTDLTVLSTVAKLSSHIMMVLLECKSEAFSNPFLKTLASGLEKNGNENENPLWEITYNSLYKQIYRTIESNETCLMLYFLMMHCSSFRIYVLSRTDPESLLAPILKILYASVEGNINYSQIYILLIVILLLSQDEVYNSNIQKIEMVSQPWFTERMIRNMSLGGYLTGTLTRIVQVNLSQQRDMYFHTNCLAALANMSSSFRDMHPYIAQRLVGLFDLVAKKYQRVISKSMKSPEPLSAIPSSSQDDLSADLPIYADVLNLLLEILNSSLQNCLSYNAHLVYALLHRREAFTQFRYEERFKSLIGNIDMVLTYFNSKILESDLKTPEASDVLQIIESSSKTWSSGRLQTFPALKFQYQEETESHEFFSPYIWSLIAESSLMSWNKETSPLLQEFCTK